MANTWTIYNTILASVTFWKRPNIRITRHDTGVIEYVGCPLLLSVVICVQITELTKQWYNVKRHARWFSSKTTSFWYRSYHHSKPSSSILSSVTSLSSLSIRFDWFYFDTKCLIQGKDNEIGIEREIERCRAKYRHSLI